jgi:hypothetical protein
MVSNPDGAQLLGKRSAWRLAGDADDLSGRMISYGQPGALF